MVTTLLHLPIEVLHTILLYSRAGPSLNLCCSSLHEVLRSAPNILRARYLVASWHHQYELFSPSDGGSSSSSSSSSTIAPPKFVSVIPQRRRGDDHSSMSLLDFCLRFPICNHVVLGMINHLVQTLPVFGNYRLAHNTSITSTSHRSRKRRRSQGSDEDGRDAQATTQEDHLKGVSHYASPERAFTRAYELPKRLFKDLSTQSTTYPSNQVIPTLEEESYTLLRPHLICFGGSLTDLPPFPDLLLLLCVLVIHPSTELRKSMPPDSTSAERLVTSAVDSHSGYPLTKSVFCKSTFLVGLLSTLGANVRIKDGLPLVVAGRSDWVDGLRLMIERDGEAMQKRVRALDAINAWLLGPLQTYKDRARCAERPTIDSETESHHDKRLRSPSTSEQEGGGSGRDSRPLEEVRLSTSCKAKRRKLADRVQPDSRLLYEAVKAGAVHVTDYLMNEKGVAPDLKTIKALDRLTSAQGAAGGGARRFPR